MASAWGKSFGLSWSNSWGSVEGIVQLPGGCAGNPETGRSSGKPTGTWNGIPLIDIEAAKLAPQIVIVPKADTEAPVTLSETKIAEIQAQLLAYREKQLEQYQRIKEQTKAAVKASIEAQPAVLPDYDKIRKVRQARDNKDLAEFMMAFSIIVLGKGKHGNTMGKVAEHRDIETQ